MILYQACFSLSSQQLWNVKDGQFNYSVFYEMVIQIFELDKEWKEDTLAWWNV